MLFQQLQVRLTTLCFVPIYVFFSVGKVIASAAIMCGVLVLALPITIIVDNFIKVAQDEQQAEQNKLDSERQEELIASMLRSEEDGSHTEEVTYGIH